jgi:hypothetical protein
VKAAFDAPRELWVGRPAIEAILGTMAAPGWLDRTIASRASDGQMTQEPATPQDGNLAEAPPGELSAQGRVTSCASRRNGRCFSATTTNSTSAA